MIKAYESRGYRVVPGVNAKNLPEDVIDHIYECGGFVPSNEDVPMPWDADITIKDGNMIISGSVTPGGGSKGTCVITCPLQEANKLFHADLFDDTPVDILNELVRNGWGVRGL